MHEQPQPSLRHQSMVHLHNALLQRCAQWRQRSIPEQPSQPGFAPHQRGRQLTVLLIARGPAVNFAHPLPGQRQDRLLPVRGGQATSRSTPFLGGFSTSASPCLDPLRELCCCQSVGPPGCGRGGPGCPPPGGGRGGAPSGGSVDTEWGSSMAEYRITACYPPTQRAKRPETGGQWGNSRREGLAGRRVVGPGARSR